MSPKGDCTLIKVNTKARLSYAPVSLIIGGHEHKVIGATSHFEMTRKWRGMSRVKTITYDCLLEDGRRFLTRLHLDDMHWDIHQKEIK